MMVAIPELDGATGPMVFGGRSDARRRPAPADARHAVPTSSAPSDAGRARGASWWPCAAPRRAERKIGHRPLQLPAERRQHRHRRLPGGLRVAAQHAAARCSDDGYTVEVPADRGRAARTRSSTATPSATAPTPTCTPAFRPTTMCAASRICARSRRSGAPRPAGSRATAARIFVLGARFGNVFVGIQPAFGYEGDPMRLLFEGLRADARLLAPSTAGCARTSAPHAVLHFGTHGALEFMPGKQAACPPPAGRTG